MGIGNGQLTTTNYNYAVTDSLTGNVSVATYFSAADIKI